ncbi:hypothetical protein B0H11DRAFT_2078847 [Mycena galericulata]|nr:hypothetical protein B0H11DRAFT_2078847 [Mycena galericulata]
MSTNEGTTASRHYREHTRQQDGWTVLASPPGANAGADLPPPYTPEAAPAPAAAPPAAGPTGTALSFEIPTNTNVIGATRVARTKKYTRGVPFNVAFVEICGIMGLDPSTAHIGYNWDNDKISAPVHELVTAADWADCLQSGIGQTERARVRMVTCIIKNLNLPEETAVVAKPSKKRKERAPSVERKTDDFTKEYKELRSQLSCAKHRDQLCYVHPDGHHIRVEPAHVSLWAKEISLGKVTKFRPPENIMFQDYFLPERKRARTSKPESPKNPCAPTIHVTVNTVVPFLRRLEAPWHPSRQRLPTPPT